MKKQYYYDVLSRDGGKITSRPFTFADIRRILNKSFLTKDEFSRQCNVKIQDESKRKHLIDNICKFYNYKIFDKKAAQTLAPIIANENRIDNTDIFKYKVLNFGSRYDTKPMFDFYINGVTNLLLNPMEEGAIIRNKNKNIPDGFLFVRCINYTIRDKKVHADYVDINTRIHHELGLVDIQSRYYPWIIDHYFNKVSLKLSSDELYLMSPLLSHFLIIYEKILILSKQKSGFYKPMLLKNAIDASFNDNRIVVKMNKKYQLINNTFVRIVPSLIKKVDGVEVESGRTFDYILQQNNANVFSYGDVKANASGTLGSNKIGLFDYKRAINELGIYSIAFTKEENTLNGLFSFNDPKFIELVKNVDKVSDFSNAGILNNHMFYIDYENEQIVTAVNGPEPMIALNPDKLLSSVKKINQRFKLNNSRTFLYDDNDFYNQNMIVKKLDNQNFFLRNIDYMSKPVNVSVSKDFIDVNSDKYKECSEESKKIILDWTSTLGDYQPVETNYTRNALVAFVSSDVDLPSPSELIEMEINKLNDWFYSLRGVACEGFFTKEFLRQRMIVDRTERLKVNKEETDISFQRLIKEKHLVGKLLVNGEKEQFLVRTYMDCVCGGKIVNTVCKSCNNPRPLNGEVVEDYWVNFSKGFDFVKMTDIQEVEDGINVYLEYSIPLANSRFKGEELTKALPVETSDPGFVKSLNMGDFELEDLNVPLDGIYYSLGGYKSKTNGIPFAVLRLYNALKGVKYSSSDCLEKTDEVNEFLSKFKKSIVRTKMYDKQTKSYVWKNVEAWVGMDALSPTEVSQEFNKSRTEQERSFSKVNYSLYGALGFNDLNKALSHESNLNKSTEFRNELFRIANIHSSVRPMNPETEKQKEFAIKHDRLITGIKNINVEYMNQNKAFNVADFDKYSLRGYVTYSEYKNIIENYPLFKEPLFEKGFLINCILDMKEQSTIYSNLGKVFHTVYFPKREILLNMFEVIGDNNVRIGSLLGAYINVFESLAVSRLDGSNTDSTRMYLKSKSNDSYLDFSKISGKILSAVNGLLFDKEGILNEITNIAVPRLMSKQLTDIDCPYDVAIIANNFNYKKTVSKILQNMYPDLDQDWTTPEVDQEGNVLAEGGWCWYADAYGFAIREPNLFSKQNLNVKLLWSSYKADIEFKKKTGISFHKKHPGSKGIYLNSVFVAFNLEGDVDGDVIFIGAPYTLEVQKELAKVYEETKDMSFFDKNNTNEKAKFVRDTYLVPSLSYLLDEASNLNFELDTLKIGYSRIGFKDSINANFDAAGNKENIGFLTVSLWYVTFFIDFYIYNYKRLIAKGYEIPELTEKDRYELLFIFQYLLAQQNGVRAMKSLGAYGKITSDALIRNKAFEGESGPVLARSLLDMLITEYKEENEKQNISIDFSGSLKKLYEIFDNLFVSSGKFKGFGYVKTPENEVIGYKDSRWTNGEKNNSKNKIQYMDCSDCYDAFFIDFEACFLLINGRDPSVFIEKFGYTKTLQSLEFSNKVHLHSPLLSFAKDVFLK